MILAGPHGRTFLTNPWFSTRPGYYQGEPIAADIGIAIHQTLVTGHAHNQAALNRLRSAGSPICTACDLGGLRDSKLPGLWPLLPVIEVGRQGK
jgi:hypothetical protein